MRAELGAMRPPALSLSQLQVASQLEAERARASTVNSFALFTHTQAWLNDALYLRLWNAGDFCALKAAPAFYKAGRERSEPQGNAWLRAVVIEFDEAYTGLVCSSTLNLVCDCLCTSIIVSCSSLLSFFQI